MPQEKHQSYKLMWSSSGQVFHENAWNEDNSVSKFFVKSDRRSRSDSKKNRVTVGRWKSRKISLTVIPWGCCKILAPNIRWKNSSFQFSPKEPIWLSKRFRNENLIVPHEMKVEKFWLCLKNITYEPYQNRKCPWDSSWATW